jgi:hypothetical protein
MERKNEGGEERERRKRKGNRRKEKWEGMKMEEDKTEKKVGSERGFGRIVGALEGLLSGSSFVTSVTVCQPPVSEREKKCVSESISEKRKTSSCHLGQHQNRTLRVINPPTGKDPFARSGLDIVTTTGNNPMLHHGVGSDNYSR